MKMEVNLPKVLWVSDYHEISAIREYLAEFIDFPGGIKATEIELGDMSGYYGLFYVGKRPSKEEIDKLVKKID